MCVRTILIYIILKRWSQNSYPIYCVRTILIYIILKHLAGGIATAIV